MPVTILHRTYKYDLISFWAQDGYICMVDERPLDSNGKPIPDEDRVTYNTPAEMEARAKGMLPEVAKLREQGDRQTARVMLKMLHDLSTCIDEAKRQGGGLWSPVAARERSEAGRRMPASLAGLNLPRMDLHKGH